MTFRRKDDTGCHSEVDYRQCTKISETVPNSGKFVGEPPHKAAQPPHAVAKHNSNLHFIFPCLYLYLFLDLCLYFIFIFIFDFIFIFILIIVYVFIYFNLFLFWIFARPLPAT